jgi:hypothetical protein
MQIAPVMPCGRIISFMAIMPKFAPIALNFARVVPHVSPVIVAFFIVSPDIAVVMVILRHHAARAGKNHEHKARQKSFHAESSWETQLLTGYKPA